MAESKSSVLSINANFTWHSHLGSSATVSDHPQRARDTAWAMSEENVEIVRRLYGFWTQRDYSTLPEIAHPDVVIDLSRNVFNPAVYRGLDGFRDFVDQADEMWEGLSHRER
jgi:hypothetical protein